MRSWITLGRLAAHVLLTRRPIAAACHSRDGEAGERHWTLGLACEASPALPVDMAMRIAQIQAPYVILIVHVLTAT